MKYKLLKIADSTYTIEFDNYYDAGMTFLRVQEFYENPHNEFRNQSFSLFRLMEQYSKTQPKTYFTYPHDWVGFNIPSDKLFECFKKLEKKHYTPYDYFMKEIINSIKKYNKSKPFYLLGYTNSKENKKALSTLKHELAHAFYYLHPKYKKAMDEITKEHYSPSAEMKKILLEWGYVNEVVKDEIQAYMATGLIGEMNSIKNSSCRKLYKKKFDEYYKKLAYKIPEIYHDGEVKLFG